MSIISDYKKLSWKIQYQQLKAEAKVKAKKAWVWIVDNNEVSLPLIGMAIGGGVKLAKYHRYKKRINKEEELKDLYCYDRSLGHYWKLRRKLTNAEWLEINERKANGENLGDILRDMRVLA